MAYHSIGLGYFANREFRRALREYEYSLKFLEADPDSYTIDDRRTFYAYDGGTLAGCGRKEEGQDHLAVGRSSYSCRREFGIHQKSHQLGDASLSDRCLLENCHLLHCLFPSQLWQYRSHSMRHRLNLGMLNLYYIRIRSLQGYLLGQCRFLQMEG